MEAGVVIPLQRGDSSSRQGHVLPPEEADIEAAIIQAEMSIELDTLSLMVVTEMRLELRMKSD